MTGNGRKLADEHVGLHTRAVLTVTFRRGSVTELTAILDLSDQ
jgi:hypothetical protein